MEGPAPVDSPPVNPPDPQPSPAPADDEARRRSELVHRALAGEPLALDKLLMGFGPRLMARIERRLPRDVRAVCAPEDLLQEACAEAFEGVAGVGGGAGQFTVPAGQDAGEAFFRWMATIADHQVIDVVRSLRAAKRGGGGANVAQGAGGGGGAGQSSFAPLLDLLAVDEWTPSRSVGGHEAEAALRAALDTLYPAYREALELRYLLGLTPAEVAARLGRTEQAVHQLCSRAIGALREAMGDPGRFLSRGG